MAELANGLPEDFDTSGGGGVDKRIGKEIAGGREGVFSSREEKVEDERLFGFEVGGGGNPFQVSGEGLVGEVAEAGLNMVRALEIEEFEFGVEETVS